MNTYELMNAVIGYEQVRTSSCYMVINGVLLRIADHQANFVNFECFNDDEEYNSIVNVIITNNIVNERAFEDYLDSKDMRGEMVVIPTSDDINESADYIKMVLRRY